MGSSYTRVRRVSFARWCWELMRELWRSGWSALLTLWTGACSRPWAGALFLVAVTLAAFGPAWHGGFVWDDNIYITDNPLLTDPHGLRKIWFSLEAPSQYFPLTYTSFYIERALWHLNPAGYHVVNILLQGLAAVLAWRVLVRLGVPGAWLAAAIFAIHPVQVESVAWVSERKNVLMGVFFFLTAWAWIRFLETDDKRRWNYYAAALVCCFLALSAKTTACTLPAALVLVLWLTKRPVNWTRLMQVAPFAAMAAGFGVISMYWEHAHTGMNGKLLAIAPVDRLLIAGRAFWFYLGKLIWPFDLCASYGHWAISPSNPLAWLWLAAVAALAGVLWWTRQRLGRGPEVAAMFFAATLAPMLGFFMLYTFVYSFVADHYQYLACLGPIALVAAAAQKGLRRLAAIKPLLEPAAGLVIVFFFGALTWVHSETYTDSETLWRETLRRNPNSSLAHVSLGQAAFKDGQFDVAIAHFKKALELNPNLTEAYYNVALSYSKLGQMDQAISFYRKEAELHPEDALAHNNLGKALIKDGKVDQGIAELQKALALLPNDANTQANLGMAFMNKGETDQAIVYLEKAVQIDPNQDEAENILGIALANKGKSEEAIAHFKRAVLINPDNATARSNLGMALAQSGDIKAAIAQYQKILEINADQMEACNNLAWLLATAPDQSLRDGPRAVDLALHAVDIGGVDNPVVLHTLASAYAETGKYQDALATARHALELADNQTNKVLAEKLRKEIQRYENHSPLRGGVTPRDFEHFP